MGECSGARRCAAHGGRTVYLIVKVERSTCDQARSSVQSTVRRRASASASMPAEASKAMLAGSGTALPPKPPSRTATAAAAGTGHAAAVFRQMMKSAPSTMPSPLASPAGARTGAEVLLPDFEVEIVDDAVAVEVGTAARSGTVEGRRSRAECRISETEEVDRCSRMQAGRSDVGEVADRSCRRR